MGVNSLPKTVTRERPDCDLNPGPSAPKSSTLTTRPPSHLTNNGGINSFVFVNILVMPLTQETYFPDILRQDKCYGARQLLKSFI